MSTIWHCLFALERSTQGHLGEYHFAYTLVTRLVLMLLTSLTEAKRVLIGLGRMRSEIDPGTEHSIPMCITFVEAITFDAIDKI